ncbi:hypothetical protein NQ315_012062 [Exocentrus adspersus]|uniref:Fcf2 pre-rRNA processing C-terminal domain-containing protein n=1 Tax=Exocentrus adspersus TaxID=1586481 RepID=A0AAV8VXP0_9CUCU|nr:hypothetical protein NQ315_012062 [Exocentrus adspersus]
MNFVIDTIGESVNNDEQRNESAHNSFINELFKDYENSLAVQNVRKSEGNTIVQEILYDLKRDYNKHSRRTPVPPSNFQELEKETEITKILNKSRVLTSEFEKLHAIPPIQESDKKLKYLRKIDRAKTKGEKWFGLPATEMTEEIKHDLEILQMRSVLDPKRFYKKNDLKVLPKYFQVGKVIDSPLDYYNNRLVKKQRKNTLVDELLADAEFNKYNKRKYKEIIDEKQKNHYKAWRQAKKLKKRK